MNRTGPQAMLAELAWKRGAAGGAAAWQSQGRGEDALPGQPRLAPGELRDLARQAGAPAAPGAPDSADSQAAWERAFELAGDAHACAFARAAQDEDGTVSQKARYLPGWPVATGSRSGFLAGPATLDGHPWILFEDGTEEALPRAAVTGCVVFVAEDSGQAPPAAATGDIVASFSRCEALAVSAGLLVSPDPDLAGPGTLHAWPDLLTAALFDAGLKNGRAPESFAATGFHDAIAARDRMRTPPRDPASAQPGRRRPGPAAPPARRKPLPPGCPCQ